MKNTCFRLLPAAFIMLFSTLLAAGPPVYDVTGMLEDEASNPVAGHPVMLYDHDSEIVATDTTDGTGGFTLSYEEIESVSIEMETGTTPASFRLGSSYPNPFNPRTSVPFDLPRAITAEVSVHTILGQEVLRRAFSLEAGSHVIEINLGGRLSQGQYLLRVQGGGFTATEKMTFLSAGISGGTPSISISGGTRSANQPLTRRQALQELPPDSLRLHISGIISFYVSQDLIIEQNANIDLGVIVLENAFAEVTNPETGRMWMDRNLGAGRVAISSTDEASYGDLYQWGRAADGHQIRSSETTTTLSDSDQPGHGDFILAPDNPYNWNSTQNDDLWQGVNGINNPCPAGYRLPTEAEWEAERVSWDSNDADGAYASSLKLPMPGLRGGGSGSLFTVGSYGYYWSSNVLTSNARYLAFYSDDARIYSGYRALGLSVRCIKDASATYTLTLEASPLEGGLVEGAGEYEEGAEIPVTASANAGYSFVNWSGDTDYIEDANAESTTVTMPAWDITLTANFEEEAEGWPRDSVTVVIEVTNPETGRVWMDRNLGASRAATSSTDEASYGNLYQWGRVADGHQLRTSSTTTKLSDYDQPGHSDFILAPHLPQDWRSTQNDALWQGVTGSNNPCPVGFRLPTEAEWQAERASWSNPFTSGAIGSILKLPTAGWRSLSNGSLVSVGAGGRYWSSTVSGSHARVVYFDNASASIQNNRRATGIPVRCIKN